MSETANNVVLVHGGFVDGSGWQGVYDALRAEGFRVSVVQNPTLSLEGDVAATRQILDAQDGPVVLVGHSYGGVVVTEAGTHDNVTALAYIAAFVPDKGESVNSLIADPPPGAPVPPILPPDNGFLFLDREQFHGSFAGDRVASTSHPVRNLLEHLGDPLIRFHRGVGEMPGPAFRLVHQVLSQEFVRTASFITCGRVHDRGTGQGMAKLQPVRDVVDTHELRPLRRGQIVEAASPRGSRTEDRQRIRAVEHSEQQQLPSTCRQLDDSGLEHVLQTSAQWQDCWKRVCSFQLRPAERHGKLEQRERIAARLSQQTIADRPRQPREPVCHQGQGCGIVERPDVVARQPAAVEEPVLVCA